MSSIINSGVAVSNIAGSMDNITFSRNQFGPYVKGKSPGPGVATWLTSWQTAMGGISAYWHTGLSESQRQLWIEAAGYSINKLSKRTINRGFQLWMRRQLNWWTIGLSGHLVPRPTESLWVPTAILFAYIPPAIAFNVAWNPPLSGNWWCVIYASPPVSQGRMTPSVPYARITWAVSGNTMDILPAYIAHYGSTPTIGKKVWVKICGINSFTGQRGPYFSGSVII